MKTNIKHQDQETRLLNIVDALYHKLYTQPSAPEDGRKYRPKHGELIEIINKIIIVASSRLFILLYGARGSSETSIVVCDTALGLNQEIHEVNFQRSENVTPEGYDKSGQ